MRIRISYIASIPTEDLVSAGVDLNDLDEIQDFYYDNGGEETYHDVGETFEIIEK